MMNRLSLKPLAAFNSAITNFNVKNPLHGQHSIYHWSWDMIEHMWKAQNWRDPKLSFRTLWLAPSPSFFPPRQQTPRPKLFLPHSLGSFLIWTEHLSLSYIHFLLWYSEFTPYEFDRYICINIISYSKFQECRDRVHGNIFAHGFCAWKSLVLWNDSKINQVLR